MITKGEQLNQQINDCIQKNQWTWFDLDTTHWIGFQDWIINGSPNWSKVQQIHSELTGSTFSLEEYRKDWHFALQYEQKMNQSPYTVPPSFQDDWLNEYCLEKKLDDYRFVYMGVAGTSTLLHADVFRSYSWSVNLCGKKKWYL